MTHKNKGDHGCKWMGTFMLYRVVQQNRSVAMIHGLLFAHRVAFLFGTQEEHSVPNTHRASLQTVGC